ncbi:unnamed protein product [Nezara viridula]|uniref:PIF1/LRR1 pleckstrin homology domain-containing protein n=1 Tax=Nezara viridula TaxID=85310 RepID=A0A9P0HHT1_NEZVI|nr:unnamed protein product [Nezara viridula]
MRISASVEISNRLLPSLNLGNRRPEKSYLSIGYLPGQKEKVFILHQTIRNGHGVKYKVNDNIGGIFVKFIVEGKATLRFKEPPVDLIIKGEPKPLSNFLQVLKQFMDKKVPLKLLQLSNLAGASSKVDTKPVKLVLKQKKEFPIFPRALETLQINEAMMKKFDCKILRLQKLKILNLADNCLEDIPNEIDLLPALEELHLAKNKIGEKSKFTWLSSQTLRLSLIHLDLRENCISFIPQEICRLKNLKNLLLDKNRLQHLPNGLGLLSKLKKLSVSHNLLEWMPGSCQFLRLNTVDVSKNNWKDHCSRGNRLRAVFNLVDISAVAVLKHRIEFSEELIPRTLVCYLENAGYCSCGIPVFPSRPNKFAPLDRFLSAAERVFVLEEEPVIGFCTCFQHST